MCKRHKTWKNVETTPAPLDAIFGVSETVMSHVMTQSLEKIHQASVCESQASNAVNQDSINFCFQEGNAAFNSFLHYKLESWDAVVYKN